jgi:3-hydroxyisobutyrate dehydrogenase-like beta-hydroxyacid dehydrogenase
MKGWNMKKISFIGVGVMGKSMVRNLMKHGFEVSIYARTKEKVEDVLRDGAIWCESIAECVKQKDAVITIVGYPKDVEEVYFGETGILENANKGTYLIDMTTTSPKLSIRLYEEGKKRELHSLDAPVTGGDSGAKNGTLSIMIGGEEADYIACRQIFEAMGTTIVYGGKPGNGQHTKMANQIAIAGAIAGVSEALTYGSKVGLDLQTMLDSISMGSAGSWQMSNMAPRMLKGDFAPGFYIKHIIKDLQIADEEAKNESTTLEVLEKVLEMFRALEEKGKGDLGTQALCQYYD